MSADTTRRNLLTGAAAVGAGLDLMPFVRPAAAAQARNAGASGPIEAMFPEHLKLEAAYDAALGQVIDLEPLFEEPDRPGWHPIHAEGGYETIVTRPGRGMCVLDDGAANIAYLKSLIAAEFEPDAENSGCPNSLRAARARKTLGQIEDWHAEVRRRKDVIGLTEAEQAATAAGGAACAHRSAMLNAEATSLRELAFQALVLGASWEQMAAEHVIHRLPALAGVSNSDTAELLAVTDPQHSAPTHPDAALLALREPYDRTLAEMDAEAEKHSPFEDALFEAQQLYPDRDRKQLAHDVGFDEADARYVEKVDANMAAIQAIIDVPARTIEGLRLKATVSQREANLIPELVEGVIADLLAMPAG